MLWLSLATLAPMLIPMLLAVSSFSFAFNLLSDLECTLILVKAKT